MKNCIQTLAIYINYEKGQCKQEKIRIMKDFQVLHAKRDTDKLDCIWTWDSRLLLLLVPLLVVERGCA